MSRGHAQMAKGEGGTKEGIKNIQIKVSLEEHALVKKLSHRAEKNITQFCKDFFLDAVRAALTNNETSKLKHRELYRLLELVLESDAPKDKQKIEDLLETLAENISLRSKQSAEKPPGKLAGK
jgi:uncharacterized protein (DUF1778 family)